MLDSNEKFEIKKFSSGEWHEILSKFSDATFFQTIEFANVNYGNKSYEHAVLYRDSSPVSICQMRIIRFPLNAGGLICSNAGPMWKTTSCVPSITDLEKMLFKLKETYVLGKNYTLVLKPWVFVPGEDGQSVTNVFEKCGFEHRDLFYKTAYLPLNFPLETIKGSIDRRWRQKLSKVEKLNLHTEMGNNPELFRTGISIYKEMLRRKRFLAEDISKYQIINDSLPESKKLRTVVCYDKDEPLSFLSCSILGDTAIALFAATSDKSLELNSSFLCWWRMIEMLKDENVSWLNIGGINKERNPGSYRFKSAIYKKTGYECGSLGQFWCHGSSFSQFTCNFLWKSKVLLKRGKRILESRFIRKIEN